MTQQTHEQDLGGFHPLFLPLDGQDEDFKPEPIRAIIVYRIDRGNVRVNKGTFLPQELLQEGDIQGRFGGGTYELLARRSNGTVYARRQFIFDGAPTDAPQAQGASPLAPIPSVAHGSPDQQMLMTLITMFMNMQQKSSDDTKQMMAALMQMQNTSAAQNQQMLIAMMTAQQNAGQSGTQAMSSVLGQVLSTKLQPGADPVAMATKVIELSKVVGAEKAGATDWTTIVQGVLAGLGMLAQMGAQQQQPQPQTVTVQATPVPDQQQQQQQQQQPANGAPRIVPEGPAS